MNRTQSNFFQSNSIEINSWIKFDWVRQSNEIELTEKKKNQSNPTERSIFELVICVKQALKIHNQILEARVTSAWSVAHVFFGKRRNSAEMASNALWIVTFKCVVKGYQECRFDVKHDEVFKVLKKIGEKGCAFCVALGLLCIGLPEPIKLNPLNCVLPNSIEHNQMDWVRLSSICSIELDLFGNRTHWKSGVRFRSIAKLNRTQSTDWVRLSSIFERSVCYAGWYSAVICRKRSALTCNFTSQWFQPSERSWR